MGKVGKFNNVQEIRLAKKTNFVEFIEDIWVYSEPAIIMISFSIGFMLCPSLKTGQTAGDLLYHKSRDTTGNSGYWGRGWVGGGGGEADKGHMIVSMTPAARVTLETVQVRSLNGYCNVDDPTTTASSAW